MVLLVAYDLHKPDRDYTDVENLIKSLGSWCHLEESVWLLDTTSTPSQVRDALQKVGEDATYFTQRVTSNWASFNASSEKVKWLKSSSRSW
jgi:hypothetical protein